ncbi:hypothetical protein [Mesorhizobium sp.]|nr:hypothetical protein [Mesorhizobium sp.]
MTASYLAPDAARSMAVIGNGTMQGCRQKC